MFSFRSVAIPALSICLNLLSVGAAYGVMTWIFQGGHLQGVLDFSSYGGITPWLPLFMFVLLFGLSMDYHVFILSRIRELRLRGASAKTAVDRGDHLERGRRDQRGRDHGGGVLHLRHAVGDRVQGVRRRDGGRRAHRRDVVRGVLLPAGLALLGDRAWAMPGLPRFRARNRAAEAGPGTVREKLSLTLDDEWSSPRIRISP